MVSHCCAAEVAVINVPQLTSYRPSSPMTDDESTRHYRSSCFHVRAFYNRGARSFRFSSSPRTYLIMTITCVDCRYPVWFNDSMKSGCYCSLANSSFAITAPMSLCRKRQVHAVRSVRLKRTLKPRRRRENLSFARSSRQTIIQPDCTWSLDVARHHPCGCWNAIQKRNHTISLSVTCIAI